MSASHFGALSSTQMWALETTLNMWSVQLETGFENRYLHRRRGVPISVLCSYVLERHVTVDTIYIQLKSQTILEEIVDLVSGYIGARHMSKYHLKGPLIFFSDSFSA